MESASLVDCAGRRRSPATLPGYHRGRPPRNKGLRYPPDPPTVEEIIAVVRAAGDEPDGVRLRGLIVVLWRAGLRISEALALAESDLDRVRGAIQVRHGKGGRRREVGMDRWAWEALDPWLTLRAGLPIGTLFCVLRGPTRGRPCSAAGVRVQLRNAAVTAGVRRRLAPHQYADMGVMPTLTTGPRQAGRLAHRSRHNEADLSCCRGQAAVPFSR
jgi:integrase